MELVTTTDIIDVSLHEKNGILATNWATCATAEEYIAGISAFKEAYMRVLPKHTLWYNNNCEYSITPDLQHWTDSFLNVAAIKAGFDGKVGIVVGDNMLHLLSVANLFEEGEANVNSRFFKDPEEAMQWLLKSNKRTIAQPPQIKVRSLSKGQSEITLQIASEELNEYIFLLNRMLKSSLFKMAHAEQFHSLSAREKEIFQLIVRGLTNPMIAAQLYISIDTVKTHRKNIMQKLRCRNVQELLHYAIFVQL
ncbi:response regulator transcription factor [Chitinophaga sp. Hz27]|uniref:response regulator transcription factor n=1 Tax=Chitinophaga sp. Hz27 TaxID=3347169 RepID=UPI0035DDBFBD